MNNRWMQIGILIVLIAAAIIVVVLIYSNPSGELEDSVKTIQESSPKNTNKTSPST